MMAMFGGETRAQESGTPVAQSNDYVSVNCTFDSNAGESSCTYALDDSDGSNPGAFIVYSSQLCASPLRIGAFNWTNDGDLSQSLSVGTSATLTFPGLVSASAGGGEYGLVANGGVTGIAGDSIACTASLTTSGNAAGDGNSSTSSSDVSTDTVTATFYDCTTDPGVDDPASDPDCAPASGVSISVTADGADAGSYTSDPSGVATFDVPDGSAIVVTEDQTTIATGYVPYGDGRASLTAADDASLVFVHLPESLMGRTQILSGTCPTSGNSGTVFRVIEPGVVTAASVTCTFVPNVAFTLSGGALGPSGLAVKTDGDGNWRGFLLPGDYTITSDDGQKADFTVYLAKTTAIVAINYEAQPTGTISIARWQCSGDVASTTIDIAGTQPDDPADCTASNKTVNIAEVGSGASPAEITLGATGKASVDLKPASYVLTDETSGETAQFDIAAGQTVYAVITATSGSDDSGNGSNGNGSGGNESNGSGGKESNGNSSNGNGSGDNGNASSGDDGGQAGGEAESGGDDVTDLPDTGVFQAQPAGATPLAGIIMIAGLLMIAGWTQRRRAGLGR
jgi:hypothetical protein